MNEMDEKVQAISATRDTSTIEYNDQFQKLKHQILHLILTLPQ